MTGTIMHHRIAGPSKRASYVCDTYVHLSLVTQLDRPHACILRAFQKREELGLGIDNIYHNPNPKVWYNYLWSG